MSFQSSEERSSALIRIAPVGRRDIAVDWAVKLYRMYEQWGVRNEARVAVVSDTLRGPISTRAQWLHVDGFGMYGLLRSEQGVHQLINENDGGRKFIKARVDVYPKLVESLEQPGDSGLIIVDEPGFPVRVCEVASTVSLNARIGDFTLRVNGAGSKKDMMIVARTLLETFTLADELSVGNLDNQTIRLYDTGEPRVIDKHNNVAVYSLSQILDGDLSVFLDSHQQVSKFE